MILPDLRAPSESNLSHQSAGISRRPLFCLSSPFCTNPGPGGEQALRKHVAAGPRATQADLDHMTGPAPFTLTPRKGYLHVHARGGASIPLAEFHIFQARP